MSATICTVTTVEKADVPSGCPLSDVPSTPLYRSASIKVASTNVACLAFAGKPFLHQFGFTCKRDQTQKINGVLGSVLPSS